MNTTTLIVRLALIVSKDEDPVEELLALFGEGWEKRDGVYRVVGLRGEVITLQPGAEPARLAARIAKALAGRLWPQAFPDLFDQLYSLKEVRHVGNLRRAV